MKRTEQSDAGVMRAFRAAGQGHVFRWWEELSPDGRARLMAQLRGIDLESLAALASDVKAGRFNPAPRGSPEFPSYVRLPRTPEESAAREKARSAGEALLRHGKVAALTVAGGQGTRLGFDAPKGTYPIGPVSGKSLFRIHAERILATRRRYRASLRWYVMTSDATDQATKDYFERENYFHLPRQEVSFFRQRMMPVLDRDFRLVLAAKDAVLLSPNGHGGALLALAECGMLDDMERWGVEEISYFQVDNALVPAADPVFLGCHSLASAQMSGKAVWKREPEEAIGAFVGIGGRVVVMEYSDLTREQTRQRGGEGQLRFGLGSIAVHAIRVDFARRETGGGPSSAEARHVTHEGGFRLPFHLAEKSSPYLDEAGRLIQPQGKNVYKFETFIFDALRDAERTMILEVRREEQFSPLKNATGKDSPETCRRDMSALYAAWLARAGVHVPGANDGRPAFPIEISPLYALDADELASKVPKNLALTGPLYLGPEKRV